jgi:hypothetical protein
MTRWRGIVWAFWCRRGDARRQHDAARAQHPSRLIGWLAVASLLLHGWVPIVIQIHLADPEAGAYAHSRNGPHASVPSGEGPECPLLHSAICLCATFVKLLPAAGAPAPGVAFGARDRRGRFPARRPSRPRPALPFDARAPPGSS